MQIEISSPHPINQPTPISVRNANALPDGELSLRCEKTGQTIPAQKDGNDVVFILSNLAAGENKRFAIESASESTPGVTLQQENETLEVRLPDGAFGIYRFGKDVNRPYVWPLYGPGDVPLTRAFPMQQVENETVDHPHHTSLWTAFDEVNEVNNWHNAPGHGFTRHQSFSDVTSGPVFGGFTAHSVWVSSDEKPFLDETRVLRVYNVGEDARLFDYEITLAANYGDVTFNDTKEAGIIAVRVATSMDGARGGVITNSEGGRGESECWGHKAAWCDYSGEVNGKTFGVTIYDHPQSFQFPTRWHVRDYGLFATNPASTACFKQGEPTTMVIKSGESETFRYRVLLHRGDAASARVGELFPFWSEAPAARILS